jgi:hypothetical protein
MKNAARFEQAGGFLLFGVQALACVGGKGATDGSA